MKKHWKKLAGLAAAGLLSIPLLFPQAFAQFEQRIRNSDDIDFRGHISVRSDVFEIRDQTTDTKRVQFDLSGITEDETRVFVLPDESGTIVTTTAADFTTLILPLSSSPAQTAEGSVVWNSTSDLLTVGTSAARKTMVDTNSTQTLSAKTLTTPVINGTLTGTGAGTKTHFFNVGANLGATSGWILSTGTDVGRMATLPAGETASTLVVRINGLAVGDSITAFYLLGQVESAANTVTIDASLKKLVASAADLTNTLVSSMTQISVVADTAITAANSTKTLVSASTVASDESYYILITATTGASTDIDLMGVAVAVTHKYFNSGE